jgi:hypothetical protein
VRYYVLRFFGTIGVTPAGLYAAKKLFIYTTNEDAPPWLQTIAGIALFVILFMFFLRDIGLPIKSGMQELEDASRPTEPESREWTAEDKAEFKRLMDTQPRR